ncbi:MAG: hypothetical protein LQ340_003721 [Diploschistes diacapsis]|nr:MAG: hypothetical protein LQ340_003721 [Diploschistes diacapsis]
MGPSLKKRKIIDGTASQRAFNQSIIAFGRVTKSSVLQQAKKDKAIAVKFAHESDSEREHKKPSRDAQRKETKKRRREEEEDTQIQSLEDSSINLVGAIDRVNLKSHKTNGVGPATPSKSRKKAKITPKAVTETPTKGARTFLEAFMISSPHSKRSSSPAQQPSPPSSINSEPLHTTIDQNRLSEETQDLVDLHNAFLNALSLHYAHNGTSSPFDIRQLIPGIKRRWGKRHITTEDVQRLLGIQQHGLHQHGTGSCLSLIEYSRSKICLEYSSPSESAFPVDTLRNIFLSNIQKILKSGKEYPLAPITPLASEKQGPSKGALRLAEIKCRPVEAQPAASAKLPQDAASTQPTKPDSRAASLVDRIRMKEAHAASLPAPPSAEALARRAALMRLEEVIPVLEILSGSSSASVASRNLYSSSSSQASLDALMRPNMSSLGASLGIGPAHPAKVVSFTLGTVMQHLQNSLKHPIAKEEAERCVRLLATEVAPRWIGIREVGKVVGITFRGKVGRAEWTGRLRELIDAT